MGMIIVTGVTTWVACRRLDGTVETEERRTWRREECLDFFCFFCKIHQTCILECYLMFQLFVHGYKQIEIDYRILEWLTTSFYHHMEFDVISWSTDSQTFLLSCMSVGSKSLLHSNLQPPNLCGDESSKQFWLVAPKALPQITTLKSPSILMSY